MTEPQNIDEVILRIQQDPPVLVKDQDGQVGNQRTKYVNLNQVNEKVMPRLTGMSTIYVCTTALLPDARFALEYELKHVPSGTVKAGQYVLVVGTPQQMGSAITYARRYALLAALGLVAENEDDEGRGADGKGSAQRQAKRATPEEQRQTAQRAPSGPPLPADGLLTDGQLTRIQILFREKGLLNPDRKKAFMEEVVKHPLASTKNLTRDEAKAVIEALEKLAMPAREVQS